MASMTLEQWLRHALEKDACNIVVQHVVNGGQGSKDIETVEVVVDEAASWPSLMAGTLRAIIATDSEGMQGVQTYAFIAQGAKGENLARKTERVQGGAESEGMSSEPANMSGIVTQLMRHTEATSRLMVTSMQGILAAQARILERTSEQNEKLIGKHVDIMELAEEVNSRKHERELEIAKVEQRSSSIREIVSQLKPLIPIVANKLLAGKTGQESPAIAGQAMRALFESLTDSQQEKIAEILTPQQLSALTSAASTLFEADSEAH